MSTKPDVSSRIDENIQRVLHALITKVDKQPFSERSNKVSEPIGRIKGLTSPEWPGQDQELWDQLKELEQVQLIQLDMKARVDRLADPWRSCRSVVLLPEQEYALREALNRPDPRVDRGTFEALKRSYDVWEVPDLLQPSLCPNGLEWNEWLDGLAQVPKVIEEARQLGRKLSCYQISARVFQGRSKFLTDKENWLEMLFGLPGVVLVRPLILNVSLVVEPRSLLFIENKDTYRDLSSAHQRVLFDLERTVLIYSEGFMAGAERIRQEEGVALHLDSAGVSDIPSTEWLRRALSSSDEVPRYFFGDVDWSGAQILQRLTSIFPGLCAWRPGYQAMLEFLNQDAKDSDATGGIPPSRGHSLLMAKKQGQRPVVTTGDSWFDQQLLPLIAEGCCLDQEVL
ncbi:MAG: hypothetical protein HWE39_09980 [Oceanospirillaceae bacterium]|nr:hypothetical protein [Oceanospirillaceae bacterium]